MPSNWANNWNASPAILGIERWISRPPRAPTVRCSRTGGESPQAQRAPNAAIRSPVRASGTAALALRWAITQQPPNPLPRRLHSSNASSALRQAPREASAYLARQRHTGHFHPWRAPPEALDQPIPRPARPFSDPADHVKSRARPCLGRQRSDSPRQYRYNGPGPAASERITSTSAGAAA